MGGIVQWLVEQFQPLCGATPRPASGDYIAFDRVNGGALDYCEFRRSASLCSHPSLVEGFAETEASCTYSWAPVELSAKS